MARNLFSHRFSLLAANTIQITQAAVPNQRALYSDYHHCSEVLFKAARLPEPLNFSTYCALRPMHLPLTKQSGQPHHVSERSSHNSLFCTASADMMYLLASAAALLVFFGGSIFQ